MHQLHSALLLNWSKLFLIIIAKLIPSVCRLNYSADYADVEDVTVTAIDFDRIAGLEYYSSSFLGYFLDRGYTADVDIRVASYDWRLAPGNYLATKMRFMQACL